MLIDNYNINEIRQINKDDIIITLNDVQVIPTLAKIISLNDILDDGKVKLSNYPIEIQNQIYIEFLKYYNYIDYIDYKYLFNYTKFNYYWESNEYFQSIFKDKEPDYVITINDKIYKYYDISKLKDYELNYLGVLFMNQYQKIDTNKDFYVLQYENFTDVYPGMPFEMIKDLKEFFLIQLTNFLKMNFGDVFGFYDFGSNLQKLIQTKNLDLYKDAALLDIQGFINDLNYLYGNFITLKNIDVQSDMYQLKLEIYCVVNNEDLMIQFIKNS